MTLKMTICEALTSRLLCTPKNDGILSRREWRTLITIVRQEKNEKKGKGACFLLLASHVHPAARIFFLLRRKCNTSD